MPAVTIWGTPELLQEGPSGNFAPWDDGFVAGVHPAELLLGDDEKESISNLFRQSSTQPFPLSSSGFLQLHVVAS